MTLTQTKPFEPKTFPQLKGLEGISDKTIEEHMKLYTGYVNNTKTLMEKIGEMIASGQVGTPEYAELKRRWGFEVNGVVLHELYFGNMKPNGGSLDANSKLGKVIVENFGSIEKWEADFKATGMMRGIGWAILYKCSCTGKLANFWVSDHENGHPAGFTPLLVMDVWEHAYAVDYQPTGRKSYVDAFFKNIDWQAAESRLS